MSSHNKDEFDTVRQARLAPTDHAGAELGDELEEGFDLADLDFDPDDPNGPLRTESSAQDLLLLREAIGNYKAETLQFAEKESAAMPTPHVSKVVALWDSTPRWALGAAAVLAVGFSTVFVTQRNTQPAPVAMAAAPTAQTLADDNRLLFSVDQAISASNAPTEAELGLTALPAHSTKLARATN